MSAKPKIVSFEQSSKVCFRHQSLTEALSWAHYQNADDRLYYQNDRQHTLSMYLAGGYQTHRTDVRADYGAPGRFCLMPLGSQSHWQLGTPQQFMHLYFDDAHLKQLAIRVFDMDPRTVQLPEQTFISNPGLEALYRHNMAPLDWSAGENKLLLTQITDTILVTMLQSMGLTKPLGRLKGGLSPVIAGRVKDFIQANFARQLYLQELAAIAQLSEYHFCRMFKTSFAVTPQEYLMQIRVERVKQRLIQGDASLSDIALSCGFSNQSHMGRYFKKWVGITPGEFQKLQRP
ncbi:AraC family transcriptional regulator [Shewanella sp. AS16]|uniref:helix-turn-helix domain-containing protein n=1 Tax=Shewanella sp. AS16 TaxID=2907625 RepID=UPI001F2A95FE|nr:AraC family transcriptional regulator [Shewanella sp. AS16]MCE9685363.1 AraC family transcriptional regulator [Shewanella sp. AS16]